MIHPINPRERYKIVPTDLRENLRFRRDLLYRCHGDVAMQEAIKEVCRQDFLFWANTFAWCYEPRPTYSNGILMPKQRPFISWDHQAPAILQIQDNLGFKDLGVEKSRGEGMSWIGVLFAMRDFCLNADSSIGMISKDEDSANDPNNQDSLIWKCIFTIGKLPLWMGGARDVDWKLDASRGVLRNLRNGSVVATYAATGNAASGGRKNWFLAQPISEPVLTPSGWRPIGDLAVGDRVVGRSGKPVTVTAIHDHGIKPIKRVTFDDGAWTRSCGDHLWSVCDTNIRSAKYERVSRRYCKWGDTPYGERFKRLSLNEIEKNYLQQKGRWVTKRYHIPMPSPIEYEHVDLPLCPYFVGAWIGDGSCTKLETPCFASDDEAIVDRISKCLPRGCRIKKKRHQVYMVIRDGKGTNPLKDAFKKLDMLRTGVNKRIPDQYMRGTPLQRLELIRGLMDTDGHVRKQNGHERSSNTQFTTISIELANQFADLVRSLGGSCRIAKKHPTCVKPDGTRVQGKAAYCCYPVMPNGMCPFSLSRKVDLYQDRTTYPATRLIANIEHDGEEQCRCITVDAEDHLYVTRNFVVTSNCDELSKFPKPADREVMASTQHVTNSRLVVSTPLGASGAYYDFMHEPSSKVWIVLDWKQNPTRNRGLYRIEKGVPVAIDPVNNPLTHEYDPPTDLVLDRWSRLRRKGFKLEDTERSGWYDNECDRPMATPQNIAQELDRDYGGSAYRVLGVQFNEKAKRTAIEHIKIGDVNFDREKLESFSFIETDSGPFKLWMPLDANGNPPVGRYVIGADVAVGTGGSYSSNSSAFVMDLITNEQVAEYACNTIAPKDFADLCIAMAKWLGEAFLSWESNGPGKSFTNQVVNTRMYGNIFYRKILWKRGSVTKEAGWHTDENTKEVLFDSLQNSVITGELVIRSLELVKECGQYVRKEGRITHALIKNAADDSQGVSHGDRVIAAGVCLQAALDRPLPKSEESKQREAPRGTPAKRAQEWEEAQNRAMDVWDTGSIYTPEWAN